MLCVVENCDKPAGVPGSAKAMCSMHYTRHRRYGDVNQCRSGFGKGRQRGVCTIDGCSKPHASKGMCQMHAMRMKRHGDPHVRNKGEGLHYVTVHKKVRATRGKAANYSCVDCGGQATDWSYTHEDPNPMYREENGTYPYSSNIDFYEPRCKPCHRAFDKEVVA